MPLTKYGTIPVSGIRTSDTYTYAETSTTRVTSYLFDIATGSPPAPNIGIPNNGWTNTGVAQEPQGSGVVKYTYTSIASVVAIPPTTYQESTTYNELDIRQHPNWAADFAADWDEDAEAFKPSSPFYGVTSYIVGTTNVTKTVFSATQPNPQFATVGKTEAPGGDYTDASKWLIVGTSRSQKSESLFAVDTDYLYSAIGWNSTIYDPA